MIKIYKHTVYTGQAGNQHPLRPLTVNTHPVGTNPITKWVLGPALLAGAVLGILAFSLLFALIMIPLGILGIGAWLRLQKLKETSSEHVIDAEYTVVTKSTETRKGTH